MIKGYENDSKSQETETSDGVFDLVRIVVALGLKQIGIVQKMVESSKIFLVIQKLDQIVKIGQKRTSQYKSEKTNNKKHQKTLTQYM